VQGELSALIDFVESLNTEFTTGVIEATQIDIPQSDSEETPSINIQMTIYSYEVNDNV
jgi:hypothetical protein